MRYTIKKMIAAVFLLFIIGAVSRPANAEINPDTYKPKIAIVYTKKPSAPTYKFIQRNKMRAYWFGPRNPKANIQKWLDSLTRADIEKFDGLFVPGGGDVTPALYGQKKHQQTHNVSLRLDKLQIGVIKKFAAAGKPIMGICRGIQVVNVAFGGTLCQHITGWHTYYRTIRIKKNSFQYSLYGESENVYHFHHQCVKKVAPGFVATAWDSADGHIEAIEHKTKPIVCVQWHPENTGSRGNQYGLKFRKLCIKYKLKAQREKKATAKKAAEKAAAAKAAAEKDAAEKAAAEAAAKAKAEAEAKAAEEAEKAAAQEQNPAAESSGLESGGI